MRYDCVIWDWNGTLIDDMHVSLAAVNRLLSRRGMKLIGAREYYDYIDTPIRRFYERLFDLEKTDISELLSEFNENYDALLCGDEVKDGTRAALAAVAKMGALQVVLSAFEEKKLKRLLAAYGIDGFFSAVFGADDMHCGDKTERAREYFASVGLSPRRAVMIGDACHDAEVARAVGCDCVLLRGGHQGVAELETAGCPLVDNAAAAADMILKK